MGQNHRIHGTGASAADTFETNPSVLQELVQHAPGECPMGASALQGEVDGLLARSSKKQKRLLYIKIQNNG